MTSLKERFEAKVYYSIDGCHYWLASVNKKGYGYIRIANVPRDKAWMDSAHRVAYELYKGEIPEGKWVLHTCDNPGCVNPDHLFLGNNDDNVADKVSKNRQYKPKGEKHPFAKLTESQVIYIRSNRGVIFAKDLAKEHNVSVDYIFEIWARKSWKHI